MIITCPECGTRQRAGSSGAVVPGSIVACTSCSNPIVVREPPPPPPPRRDPPRAAREAPPRDGASTQLWGTAALVIVIVAAAHAGLYLLLTSDARSGMRTLEARHGVTDMRRAKQPDSEAPKPGTPAYAPWRRAVELYDDAHAYSNHRRHVSLLHGGFLASFLVQVAITAWILMRLLGKQKRRAAGRDRDADV